MGKRPSEIWPFRRKALDRFQAFAFDLTVRRAANKYHDWQIAQAAASGKDAFSLALTIMRKQLLE